MTLYTFPAEILGGLLRNVEGEISAACPFAFLLTEDTQASLDAHIPWLEAQAYLDSPPQRDGRLALRPPLRRALDIIARPLRRVLVSEVDPQGVRRAAYVIDGAEAVVAMFMDEDCVVSDPLDLEAFRDRMMKAIGPPRKRKSTPSPLQFHPALLRLLGALVGSSPDADALNPDLDPEVGAGEKKEDSLPPSDLPLPRAECAARLGTFAGDPDQGSAILEDLIEDQVLVERKNGIDIHPAFRPWHQAIVSGHFLGISRLEFPESRLQNVQPPARAYFWGPAGARCVVWPAAQASEEILVSWPTSDDLQAIVNYLVGFVDLE